MELIGIEKIEKVYSGTYGRCACGCSGKYSDSQRAIKLMVKRLEKNKAFIDQLDTDFVSFNNEQKTRTFTIYFKKK